MTQNMAVLGIEPASIDAVALSHFHSDHYAGLPALAQTDGHRPVYISPSFPQAFRIGFGGRFELIDTSPGQEVRPGVFTTGEMIKTEVGIYEQSLVVPTEKGLVIVTGCTAQSKMDPRGIHLETLLTAQSAWSYGLDTPDMRAFLRH